MLSNSLLVAVSVLLAVLLAEGLALVVFPQFAPRTARITKFWRHDSRYGWSHIPSVRGNFDSFGIEAFVTINAKGFRGATIEYARNQKRRVVVLGDSYVWGYGVSDEEVSVERLSKAMPDTEFVNMGVSGYSTDQELLLYLDEASKYKADVVIIVVTDNDPLGNVLTQQYVTYGKPAFQLKGDTLALVNQPVPLAPWWKRAAAQFATRSYLLTAANRYLYSRAVAQAATRPSEEHQARTQVEAFPRTPEEAITARLLVELRRALPSDPPAPRLLVVFTEDMVPHSRDGAVPGGIRYLLS